MHATRFVAGILLLIASATGCGSGDRSAGLAGVSKAASSLSSKADRGQENGIRVETRNLYLGADLTPVIAAQDFATFIAATTAAWAMVQRNDFHARVKALAAEIAANRPALIGLQEAYTWRTQTPADGSATPATQVAYDYVPELLAALKARGLEYRSVAQVELLDFEAPTLLGNDARLTDRGVILARKDVNTRNPTGVVFANENLLPVTVLGQTLLVKRGYVAVDVKHQGEWLRFVSTHLESFHPGIRMLQAGELAVALATETRPVVLVGDLNSHPGTEGAAILAGAGFRDVWAELHPGRPGLTCCWPEDLTKSTPGFSERIDYVLFRGPLEPRAAAVSGADPASRVAGLWPSDHGGLFAELRLEEQEDDSEDEQREERRTSVK